MLAPHPFWFWNAPLPMSLLAATVASVLPRGMLFTVRLRRGSVRPAWWGCAADDEEFVEVAGHITRYKVNGKNLIFKWKCCVCLGDLGKLM